MSARASVPIRGHFFASSGDQHANHRFNAAHSSVFVALRETCSASAASGDDNSIFSAWLTGRRWTDRDRVSDFLIASRVNIWHSGKAIL